MPQKVPLPTGRLAGDANQVNRIVEQRKVVSKRPVDVAEEWLNGTLTRVVYRGDTGFTIARVLPDGEKNSFEEEGYANPARPTKRKAQKTLGVRADACLVSSRVGDHVRLKGWWSTHPRFGKQFNADVLDEQPREVLPRSRAASFGAWPVSYTHLTLPTICSV